MNDEQKAALAVTILGIAALAHHKHHYRDGYIPEEGEHVADFERGFRDGVHGYAYNLFHSIRHYAEGYQAGDRERENSMAHRQNASSGERAPAMALRGCAQIVAQNFAIDRHHVQMIRSRSPGKHEWEIETAVGHQHMVCKMRDTGEVIEVRGGRM